MARADLLLRVARGAWQHLETRCFMIRLECGHDEPLTGSPEANAIVARRVSLGFRLIPQKFWVTRCEQCAAIPHPRTNPEALRAIHEARVERATMRRRARRHITVTDEGFGYED